MLQFIKKQTQLKGAQSQALTDATNDVYAPERYIATLGLVAPDAFQDRTDLAVERAQLVHQRTELHIKRTTAEDAITAGPARTGRKVAIVALGLAEGITMTLLFIRELDFSLGEAVSFSALLTTGSFYLTHLVRKQLLANERRFSAYGLLVLYVLFACTMTYLRVVAHETEGTPLVYSLAIGFLLCITSIVPGWFLDHLRDDVAKTDGHVRAADTIEIRIEQTAIELQKAEQRTESIAEHDAFMKQLRAAYDTAHDTKRAELGKPRLSAPPTNKPTMLLPGGSQ